VVTSALNRAGLSVAKSSPIVVLKKQIVTSALGGLSVSKLDSEPSKVEMAFVVVLQP
jgi:hypothetical protein